MSQTTLHMCEPTLSRIEGVRASSECTSVRRKERHIIGQTKRAELITASGGEAASGTNERNKQGYRSAAVDARHGLGHVRPAQCHGVVESPPRAKDTT
ncbi:hypothetical protein J6590_003438 [Homalodisca vitripennis]|nr:hypothetical protein J6590_003438 [Homalodisca vitripennis]